MSIPGLCQKCSSFNTCETRSGPFAKWLLRVAGYQSFFCKNCGFRWNQFLPLSILLNLIYFFLVMEVGFLLWNYTY